MTTEAEQLRTTVAEQQRRIDDMNRLCMFNERTMDDMLERLAASQAQIKVLRDALENCRLLAARYRKEEWAPHILRFCESGGSVANPLRQDDSALREIKTGYEAQIKVLREALEDLRSCMEGVIEGDYTPDSFTLQPAKVALSTPHDDSALRELLKAERERCAKECDAWGHDATDSAAAAIRAMGSE